MGKPSDAHGENFPHFPMRHGYYKIRLPDLGGVAGENNKYY